MTKKALKKANIKTHKPKPNDLIVKSKPGRDKYKAETDHLIAPSISAALTIQKIPNFVESKDIDLMSLVNSLREQIELTHKGDLSRMEAILTTQAHTLDTLFNYLTKRALDAQLINQCDMFMKFALRAQSQCRSTIEAISDMKNPPVMGYVKQANIAQGHQQINNGVEAADTSCASESENQQNELMERKDGERLDTTEKGAAIRADTAVEAVGTFHGTKNPPRVRQGLRTMLGGVPSGHS